LKYTSWLIQVRWARFVVATMLLLASSVRTPDITTKFVVRRNPAEVRADGTNLWFDIRQFGVEGRGWIYTKAFYDRLPAKAEGVVRQPVWDLSRNSAGNRSENG
jgi:hypothetical protein